MSSSGEDAAGHDRPWVRPGRGRYALVRLAGMLRPDVSVYRPEPGRVLVERDRAVVVRDGTVLRVNVHRPPDGVPAPVILFAHPYGKDDLPEFTASGRPKLSFRYRVMRQTGPLVFSSLTTWEGPDPVWWVGQGYAVVNCDLRGAGTSDGVGALLSAQEGEDVHDLIEWAAAQPWSSGAVGMLGVSYLALTQWRAASTRPPSLRAIAPWEGFTNAYRGLARPGGVEENGFLRLWDLGLKKVRQAYSFRRETARRPVIDSWYRSLDPDLSAIEVPALVCGSFSDNNLHSRGSFAGFEGILSPERHLYTHRGGKWAVFYDQDARAVQLRFFERHLKGREVPALPRVRLEVRDRGDHVVEVREEGAWPLERTRWTPAYLTARGLAADPAAAAGSLSFDVRRGGARFGWTVAEDTELTGPMALRLYVEVHGTDDMDLVVGVEKWSGGLFVPFEGSYGYGRDRVATGWQNLALRAPDVDLSRPFEPVPACLVREPVAAGEVVPVDIALGASSTLFRAGEQLRLVVAGRWLSPRNPLTGQFPASYRTRSRGRCTLHWGPERPARLLLPVVPAEPGA
ncbi:CocE/NonD family hydrolase [Streptomyces sp. NPDC093224]|uniref:CocE/NonD family hydrolase n=1 Tax=Streptomyces sp. NPDC093224 TaxID=3155198 RepID=UPI00344A2E70